jgi:hypothetical protein
VRVGGTPLARDRRYTVAIPNYLLEGRDGYDMFSTERVLIGSDSGRLVVTALEKYIAGRGAVAPAVEGRIVISR